MPSVGHELRSPMLQLVHVATWNVLADCYVRVPNQPWNAFSRCPAHALAWDERRPRIAAWIASSPHHVLALQEVVFEKRLAETAGEERWCVPAWLEEAAAQAGFAAVMPDTKQADIEKNAARNLRAVGRATPTGLVTLYKTDRFELTGAKHGSGSGSVLFLNDTQSGKRFAVGNIHLSGNPSKSDAHLRQLAGLIYVHAYVNVCMHACMYACMNVHTHTHTHTGARLSAQCC